MTAATLIQQASAEGVEIGLLPTGKIQLRGHRDAIHRWAETLKPYRDEVVETLQRSGWLRVTDPGGTERIVWPSDPSDYPSAVPFEFPTEQPHRPLTADEEQRIRGALEAIGEDDPAEVEAVVDQCRNDAQARRYWLRRAVELVTPSRPRLVTCGTCGHFERDPDHPRLGRCAIGKHSAPAGQWDTESRLCGEHLTRTSS